MVNNGNSAFTEAAGCLDFGAMRQLNPTRKAKPENSWQSSDFDLIRDALRGNHAAFAELVRNHDRAILRLALHLTGSPQDAQDLCQETFLKAYRKLSTFRFESSFATGSIVLLPTPAWDSCASSGPGRRVLRFRVMLTVKRVICWTVFRMSTP